MGGAASAQSGSAGGPPPSAAQLGKIRERWPTGSLCVLSGLGSPGGQPLNGHLAEVRGLDDVTGRLCLSLNPRRRASNLKKVRAANVRACRVPIAADDAECSFCLDRDGDGEALVNPCLCRGSTGSFHLRCLQEAYEGKGHLLMEYPSCPTCKHHYEGSLALMLLEVKREVLEAELKPDMRVLVIGMAASEYNGRHVSLVEYDARSARWQARLENGEIKAMRADNLMRTDDEMHTHGKINLMRSLGIAYSSANEPFNAVGQLEKAVRIEEHLFGENEQGLSVTLTNLGIIYNQLRQGAKAVEVLERALRLREGMAGEDSADLIATMSNLGVAKVHTGDTKGSLDILERALNIGERLLGEDHPDLVPTLVNFGVSCRHADKPKRSAELMERALRVQERLYGKDHPQLATTLVELGASLGAAGEKEMQVEAWERAVQLLSVGEAELSIIPVLTSLQEAYKAMGDEPKATACAERSRALINQTISASS